MNTSKYPKPFPAFLGLFFAILCDFALVLGYFYFFVYNVPEQADPTQLDDRYQNGSVVNVQDLNDNRYILMRTSAGELHLLALEKCAFYDRFHYSPKYTVTVPEKRPYTASIRLPDGEAAVTVDSADVLTVQNQQTENPPFQLLLQTLLPVLLLCIEIVLYCTLR